MGLPFGLCSSIRGIGPWFFHLNSNFKPRDKEGGSVFGMTVTVVRYWEKRGGKKKRRRELGVKCPVCGQSPCYSAKECAAVMWTISSALMLCPKDQ